VATVEVVCGKGTYIRTLAYDLGQVLGCGASLKSLVRQRCGIFDIADAISPQQFEEACNDGYWKNLLYPMDSIITKLSAVIVGEEKAQAIRNGALVIIKEGKPLETIGEYCRAYTLDGNLLGILRFDSEKKQWQPEKVFVSLTATALCGTNNSRAIWGQTCLTKEEGLTDGENKCSYNRCR
jgi:tRNA pseudouridine55 synthase